MRAILVLFMVEPKASGGLGLGIAEAAVIYGNYTMAVYMLSIPGGYLADAKLGARRAVLLGGALIAAGHFALAIPLSMPRATTFYAGLLLIGLGTGLFKPNISALVGGLYGEGDTRRDAGFSIFYMGINIGGFIAPLATGFLSQSEVVRAGLAYRGLDPGLSWHLGFAAAGFGMLLGLGLLASKRHHLGDTLSGGALAERGSAPPVIESAGAKALAVAAGTLAIMALVMLSDRPGFEWLRWGFLIVPVASALWLSRREGLEARRLAAVFVLFAAAMIFFAVFEQAGVTIALFADQLTRAEVLGYAFPSAWFQSLNSLFVILLAPLFASAWTRLGERQPSSPVKFALGLAFLGSSFLLMVPAAELSAEGRVSPFWLVGLFFLQTVGELLLSPVGLSTMTKLAPARAVGLVLGIWFLAAALGNKLAGVLGSGFTATDAAGLSHYFLWQAASLGLATLVLLALSPWVKRLMGGVT
jgi:POT family proton-dependent oligopeptide transporter